MTKTNYIGKEKIVSLNEQWTTDSRQWKQDNGHQTNNKEQLKTVYFVKPIIALS